MLPSKLKQWCFFAETINYLGHVACPRRLEIVSYTTDAIRKLQASTPLTELKSFCRLCNVFPRFVPDFARMAAQPNKDLQKKQPAGFLTLDETMLSAFETLSTALIQPTVLALPNANWLLILDTEVSDVQDGFVLSQKQQNDTSKPIRYLLLSSERCPSQVRHYTKRMYCDRLGSTASTAIPSGQPIY